MNPIRKQPIRDAIEVAIRIPLVFIPVVPSMAGLTARMYAMVMNVVRPAVTSVLTLVLFSFSLNIFSMLNIIHLSAQKYYSFPMALRASSFIS